MKKGLSKFLSLACVFALLMTMAIPAFATPTEAVVKGNTSFTSVFTLPDGLTQVKYDALVKSVNGVECEADTFGIFVKDANRVKLGLYKGTDDQKIYEFATGKVELTAVAKILVKQATENTANCKGAFPTLWDDTDDTFALYPFDNKTAARTEVDATGAVNVENDLDSDVFRDETRAYYFDTQGYLQVGNENGALLLRQASGDQDQILIGWNPTANDVIYRTHQNVTDRESVGTVKVADALNLYNRNYALNDPTVFYQYIDPLHGIVAGKTYYENDGKALTGIVGYNKTEPEYYQTRRNTGYIEMETGLQFVPTFRDQYGTTDPVGPSVWRVYGPQAADAATKNPHLSTQAANTNAAAKNNTFAYGAGTGTLVSCNNAMWVITGDHTVNKDDGTGKAGEFGNLITTGNGNFYLTDATPKGSAYKNPGVYGGSHVLANVFKFNGKLTDFGIERTISLNGVDQRFYVPVANNGQDFNGAYDGYRVATNYYRYVPTADGSTYAGITYYNNIGNTYLGWLSMKNGSATELMYQTLIKETETYIIVAGPQYIEEGTNPVSGAKIPAGWYLFDKHGKLVTGTGDVAMYGKTFNLKNDVIQTVDGELVSFDNTKVDLNK